MSARNTTKKALASLASFAILAALTACAVEETGDTAGKTDANAAANGGTKTKAKSAPKYTVAQENAIKSAESYLDMSGFSRAGLIEQLSSKAGEGFKRADAVFAVNHVKVNWKKEAVESAESYLDMSGFSRASLIEQLSSDAGEKFTLAQAKYAADQVGLR